MKTKILKYSLLFFLAGLSIASCQSDGKLLPTAQGREGEVLIVIDNNLWKGACGDSIRHYLATPVMGLPAPEPMFTLSQQNALTDFMKKFRNIVIIKIDNGLEKPKLGYKTDVYAQNQLLFNLEAPSADSAIACLDRNKDIIISHFLAKDRDAYIAYYRNIIAPSIVERVREKYRVNIVVPKEYTLDVDKEDFVWMAREEGERNWGILMWKEPYKDQSQLETENLIAKMNTMTKIYVPGPSDGSYMADEPTVLPEVKKFQKDGMYCVQLNGLWQMEHSYMGGPYVALSMVDSKRGQIVTGMGFVFYPNRDKRQMIRQLEAILYTMKPVE